MKIQAMMAVTLLGFSLSLAAAGSPEADFKAQYDQAEAARKKADSIGGEWRDTAKILKMAKETAEKGDFDKAMKLAKKAQRQSELGYEQAKSQQGRDLTPAYLKK